MHTRSAKRYSGNHSPRIEQAFRERRGSYASVPQGQLHPDPEGRAPRTCSHPCCQDNMTYKEAAAEQKRLCTKGKHLHSVETREDFYELIEPERGQINCECCPCFGCCQPSMRDKTVN